jgi:hypothetical protein
MKNIHLTFVILTCAALGACSSDVPVKNANRTPDGTNISAPPVSEVNTQPTPTTDGNIYPLANSANMGNVKPIKAGTPQGRPAPDDSVIYSELKDVPTETRVFNSHPVLLKVVKTGLPPNQVVKIYVKGGKVIDLPADKVPNMAASSATIMDAAGLKMPVPKEGPNEDVKRVPGQKP